MGLIPGQETKMPHAKHGMAEKKEEIVGKVKFIREVVKVKCIQREGL